MPTPGEFGAEDLQKLVDEAKAQLNEWANAETKASQEKAFRAFGRNEGLYTLMKLVALDTNGNGKISEKEVAKYEEHGKVLVDSYLGYFTSDGVVIALVLSIIYPLTFDATGDGLTWDGDGINLDAEQSLDLLASICLHISTAGSFCTLTYLASMYTQLSFHLPTLPAQLMYIRYIQSYMPVLVTIKNWSLIFAAAAYVFKALSTQAWFGLFSLLTVLGTLTPVLHVFNYGVPFVINPFLLKQAKEMTKCGVRLQSV